MKIIKKINNNFALAQDSKGNIMIASGKGIGFGKLPYELNDLSKIDRTFYCINKHYLLLLNEIDEKVLNISAYILDYSRKILPHEVDESLYFTLADHLNFAIKRAKKQVYLHTPLIHDINAYYPQEMEIGLYAITKINKEFNIKLLKDEAANIAMHIVEAETRVCREEEKVSSCLMDDISKIIEDEFNLKLDKDSFNYSRFVTHIQYLLLRVKNQMYVVSENKRFFTSMIEEYPKTYACVLKIQEHLEKKVKIEITQEEILYLILHVNRLCCREEVFHDHL